MSKNWLQQSSNSFIWDDSDWVVDQEHSECDVKNTINRTSQFSNKLRNDKGNIKACDIELFVDSFESSVRLYDSEELLQQLAKTHNVENVDSIYNDQEIRIRRERKFSQNLEIPVNEKKEIWKMWRNKPSKEILEQILPK